MKRIIKQQTSEKAIEVFQHSKFVLENFLFDKQLAFVNDPAPFKVAVCSRRAGKTIACVADLMNECRIHKDVVCLYITLSGDQAKRNVWREVKKLNEKFKLNFKLNEIDLSATAPNGSILYLSGAKDATQIEKFRGLAIKKCYIDECQSFRSYIKDLIDDIIGPALLDHAGTLCLIGTPGPIPTGYFHECATVNENWSKHYWTFWDNPHLPALKTGKTHQDIFNREMKRRGFNPDQSVNDPSVQREWWGKWILDSDSLLIKYDPTKNHYQSLMPNITYNYIMGIDIGFDDADAIAILAWSEHDPRTYLVEELITEKQGLSPLVEQIQGLEKKYKIDKMVMDMGGLGKKMGEEMIRQYKIPVEAADKARKMENVELLNDALRSSKFMAKSNSRFAQDSYLVEVDRDKSTPDRIKISTRFHSDIIDSVLYAFKCSYAFTYEPAKSKPHYGTKEWAEQQSSKMFEAELEGLQAETRYKSEYGDVS